MLRNVGNYSPTDAASHPWRLEYSFFFQSTNHYKCDAHELRQTPAIFQKPKSSIKVLGTRRVTGSKLPDEDPQTLGASVKKISRGGGGDPAPGICTPLDYENMKIMSKTTKVMRRVCTPLSYSTMDIKSITTKRYALFVHSWVMVIYRLKVQVRKVTRRACTLVGYGNMKIKMKSTKSLINNKTLKSNTT
jgi:hypothetical protein